MALTHAYCAVHALHRKVFDSLIVGVFCEELCVQCHTHNPPSRVSPSPPPLSLHPCASPQSPPLRPPAHHSTARVMMSAGWLTTLLTCTEIAVVA